MERLMLCFVTSDQEIPQRACRLKVLAQILSGDEWAYQIIYCLSTELSIPCNIDEHYQKAFLPLDAWKNHTASRLVLFSIVRDSLETTFAFPLARLTVFTWRSSTLTVLLGILDKTTYHWTPESTHQGTLWHDHEGLHSSAQSATLWPLATNWRVVAHWFLLSCKIRGSWWP